jgi:hypothetical protein
MSQVTKCVFVLASAATLLLLGTAVLADWYPGDPYKMHFPQLPDPVGWDVEISSYNQQHECADDWRCTGTGPVSDIHFWYSVNHDLPTQIGTVVATIYADDRTGVYSKPGQQLWTRSFNSSQFSVVDPYGTGLQGFADPQYPATWLSGVQNHNIFRQINISPIDDPFIQTEGTMYWLGLHVYWGGSQEPVGWKTSLDHYEDWAVFRDLGGNWVPLTPQYGAPYSMDFAFVITPEPSTFVLLGVVAVGLLAYAWRKRKSAY